MQKKTLWRLSSIISLGLAIYLLYLPPNQFFNKLSGGLGLFGFQTELTLTSYTMEDQYGAPRTWKDYNDKPLFFTTGFTSCRLSCPVTMKFYQKMEKHTGDKARYALLTIDPENDSAEQLANYLDAINPDFIGLRVSQPVQFKKIISELQQVLSINNEPGNIKHKNYIYLLHPKLSGLVIYTDHKLKKILNDLAIIQTKRELIND